MGFSDGEIQAIADKFFRDVLMLAALVVGGVGAAVAFVYWGVR